MLSAASTDFPHNFAGRTKSTLYDIMGENCRHHQAEEFVFALQVLHHSTFWLGRSPFLFDIDYQYNLN